MTVNPTSKSPSVTRAPSPQNKISNKSEKTTEIVIQQPVPTDSKTETLKDMLARANLAIKQASMPLPEPVLTPKQQASELLNRAESLSKSSNPSKELASLTKTVREFADTLEDKTQGARMKNMLFTHSETPGIHKTTHLEIGQLKQALEEFINP